MKNLLSLRAASSASLNKQVFYRLRSLAVIVCTSVLLFGCATQSGDTLRLPFESNKSSDEDLFVLSAKAQTAYSQSRWIEAVQYYQRVVERVPGDADAWFRLGNTYAQQGAYQRAIHAYERSLTNDSQQPKAWFNLSTAYLLNAQSALRQSYDHMRSSDPARAMVNAKLVALNELLHGRIEEGGVAGL